jgi:uncharacterized repeat protein (TIGR02543 family)
VDYGASVGTLPTATRSGYTFGGWYTGQNGGGTQFTASTTVSDSITVYAKWTINQYTVTFDADGGSGGTTRTVNHGATVGTLATATRTGYAFGGWYTQRNGGGAQFTASTAVTSAITVYAKWTINQYTVTFNADGGSGGTTRTVNHGASVGTLPTATRSGYSFDGWYTERNGGGAQFSASTTVSDSITVYAKWNLPIGTITAEFTGPRDETITLSGVKDLSWSANTSLTVSVSGSYSAYRWALDGAILAGKTASSLTLQAGNLSVKQHTLTAVVTKNGVEYTKRVTFTVAQ